MREREQVTDHDVAAFVDVVSASVGEAGRWIHYGLTSSDVLDTALALQLREAGRELVSGADALTAALVARAREFAGTLCMGRTHGVHAEPTTFGLKLAGFAFESRRNADRLRARVRATRRWASSPARSAPTRRSARRSSATRWSGSACAPRTSPPRSSRATATPRC